MLGSRVGQSSGQSIEYLQVESRSWILALVNMDCFHAVDSMKSFLISMY